MEESNFKKDQLCPACNNFSHPTADQCTTCDFPFLGTEKEQANHISKVIIEKRSLEESDKLINRSMYILIIVAVISFFQVIFLIAGDNVDPLDGVFNILIVLSLAICALFVKKYPLICIGVALVILILSYGLAALIDPSSFFRGIIMKAVIIGVLGYAFYSTLQAISFRKKYLKR